MSYKGIVFTTKEEILRTGPVAICAAMVVTNPNIRSILDTKTIKLFDKAKAKLKK